MSLVVRGDPRVSAERRKAVKRAMEELNYRPNAAARALAEKRSGLLGVVLPSIANPFFGSIVEALREPASERHFTPLVVFGEESRQLERQAFERFLESGVAGIIAVSTVLEPAEIQRIAAEIPLVVVARDPMGGRIDTVTSANREGGRLAARHALEAGYRHLVYVGRHEPVDGSVSNQRELGYLDAMAEVGRLGEALTVLTGDHTGQMVEEVFDAVGDTDCCFITVNDIVAVEIVAELAIRGIRPGKDVGVIGYDNTYLAGMHGLEITSIDQDYAAMGDAIVELMATRMAAPDLAGRHQLITPHLVKRASTRRRPWGKPIT